MGKSSWKTSSCYLLWLPWGVLCPWLFHGVLNPRVSHLRDILDLLESAGCWLGLLEEVEKAGSTCRVLRFFSLFLGEAHPEGAVVVSVGI